MTTKTFSIAVLPLVGLVLGLMVSPVLAKRAAPKAVPPVVSEGVEYQSVSERYLEKNRPAGLRVWVEAKDAKTRKSLWKVKIYEIVYQTDLETDVQDVYVKSLSVDPPGLLVTDERDKSYLVDLKKRTVREVKAAKKQGAGS